MCVPLRELTSQRYSRNEHRRRDTEQHAQTLDSPASMSGIDQPTSTSDKGSRASSRVGQLWNSRKAATFFGTSYFGPQVAASIIEAPTSDDMTNPKPQNSIAAQSFRFEGGPFSELWDLLGLLPRQKSTVDRLTNNFLTQVNWTIDAVHEATFRDNYAKFWERKIGFDDIATADIRWMALLFIILAFGALLDCPQPCPPGAQREYEESSLRFYWAARRAIVIAPSFYGESTDLVRAGLLVTRYLVYSHRFAESWLTIGFASRMAIAQGMHVDGDRWRLPRKVTETRRRLFIQLYAFDRMISLALGRPYGISDRHCVTKEVSNIWIDDLDHDEALQAQILPLNQPTPSLLCLYNFRIAQIIGKIQEDCFGLDPPHYDRVLDLDADLMRWKKELPSYFRLDQPDLSLDDSYPFLKWHRLHLHTNYHFARITLHRPYLLRSSIVNRFRHSWDACIDSACTDLRVRLEIQSTNLVESLRWSLGAHQLFSSALVLGIIAVRTPHTQQALSIIDDLEAYCEKKTMDIWINEFGLAEVKVVQLCIDKVRLKRQSVAPPSNMDRRRNQENNLQQPSIWQINEDDSYNDQRIVAEDSPSTPIADAEVLQSSNSALNGLVNTFEPSYLRPYPDFFPAFPDTGDFSTWQEMINNISSEP